MASLRNVSAVAKTVGGWQQDQAGTGLPLDPEGAAMHLPKLLQPGETIEVDRQSLDHPVVVGLARSADFELVDVENVAGGTVEADPAAVSGTSVRLKKILAFGDFSAVTSSASAVVSMSAIPAGAIILDYWIDVATAFAGTSITACVVDIGTTGATSSIANDVNVFATGIQQGTLVGKDFAAGIDLELVITAAGGGNLDDLTAGVATAHVIYTLV